MRHHQSICSKTFTRREVDGSGDKSSEETKNEICTAGSTNCTIITHAGSQITNKKQVFDSGSQRSYITDDLRRKLRLNAIKSETLHLNTFGDNKRVRIKRGYGLTYDGRTDGWRRTDRTDGRTGRTAYIFAKCHFWFKKLFHPFLSHIRVLTRIGYGATFMLNFLSHLGI